MFPLLVSRPSLPGHLCPRVSVILATHGLLGLTGIIHWSSDIKLCSPSLPGQYLPWPPLRPSAPIIQTSLPVSSVSCGPVTCSHIPGCSHLHPIIWQAPTTSPRARGACCQSSKPCACVALDQPLTVFPHRPKGSKSNGYLIGMGCSEAERWGDI